MINAISVKAESSSGLSAVEIVTTILPPGKVVILQYLVDVYIDARLFPISYGTIQPFCSTCGWLFTTFIKN